MTSHPVPAVSIRTRADERAVHVAAKLASGTTEALKLEFGPSRRLSAVVIEATRNAVDHAYEDGPPGDVEVEVAMIHGGEELVVSVRDFGNGCPMGPTSSEPPGLGLSMMSELSESLAISSRKHRGTEIDATIRLSADENGSAPSRLASHGSAIDFHDPAFLDAVIPRAIAVHASDAGGSIDAVRSAIEGGNGIATSIEHEPVTRFGAKVMIDRPDASADLEVRMGPMPERAASELHDRLVSNLKPSQRVALERAGEGGSSHRVLVALPLS